MAFNPYIPRRARVTVTVTRGNAPQTYVWTEQRMRISVRNGGRQFGNAKLEIFGLRLDTMNQIARLWLEALAPQTSDSVMIETLDVNGNFTPFFQGIITWSAVDASAMPQVKLVIEANSSFALMNAPASPYANIGPVLIKSVLTSLAAEGDFALDYADTLPQYQASDLRLVGSPMDQINALMRGYPDLTFFTNLQRVVVRKAMAPISADTIRIAPDTGLQSNPVYATSGLTFSTLFNPELRPGVALNINSIFDFVNRTLWVAAVLAHEIEPNLPGGKWHTSVAANSFGPNGNDQ